MFDKITFNGLDKNKDYGYAAKLDFFKENKEMSFKPGLNIIFAPNGTGKSTILSLLAISTASKQGGYSVVTSDWNGLYSSESLDGIEVFHDGQATMYCNPREAVGLFEGMASFDDEFLSEGIAEMQLKESTGYTTMARLAKILSVLACEKSPKSEIEYRVKKEYLKPERMKMLEPRIEKGQFSILLDEPESGLAIHAQSNIFNLINKAAKEKNLQIIVATHSLFALSCLDANFIELRPNYLDVARVQLENLYYMANCFKS